MKTSPGFAKPLTALAGLLILAFVADVGLGSVKIPLTEIIPILFGRDNGSIWSQIIWQFRLPKAITCVLAGSTLAAGGLMMQSLFRNPLAGPDVLGLSAGASLLVALVILASASIPALQPLAESPWSIAIAASSGSMIVFFLILGFAQRVRDNVSLLIIGLMISAATSALISVMQFLSRAEDLQAFMIWTMGTVGGTSWGEIRVLSVILAIAVFIAFRSVKSLNALLLGERYAQSLGVNIKRARLLIVLATSLMAGGVTAYCGPIAFVGLAVPHLVRAAVNTSNHRILLPAVMLGGACLILICDLIAQLPGSAQILPLNAITSFIGAPVVIWVVMRRKRIQV